MLERASVHGGNVDKLVKISIIVACLLAGFGVFYHYVIYLPDLEQKRAQREKSEKEEAARRAEAERIEAAKRAAIERAQAAQRAETQRAEEAKRAQIERLEAKQRDLKRKDAYLSCLMAASKDYDADWSAACKTNAESRSVALKNCLEDPNVVNNPLMGKRWCYANLGGANPSPDCSLPSSTADKINERHEKEKQRCLAEAKLF